jgi:hypothetical protein
MKEPFEECHKPKESGLSKACAYITITNVVCLFVYINDVDL